MKLRSNQEKVVMSEQSTPPNSTFLLSILPVKTNSKISDKKLPNTKLNVKIKPEIKPEIKLEIKSEDKSEIKSEDKIEPREFLDAKKKIKVIRIDNINNSSHNNYLKHINAMAVHKFRLAVIHNQLGYVNRYFSIFRDSHLFVITKDRKARRISMVEFIILKGSINMLKILYRYFDYIDNNLVLMNYAHFTEEKMLFLLKKMKKNMEIMFPKIVYISITKKRMFAFFLINTLFTYNKQSVLNLLEIECKDQLLIDFFKANNNKRLNPTTYEIYP